MKKIVHYSGKDVHKETVVGGGHEGTDILAALARRSRRVRVIYSSETQGGSFLATLG